MDQKDVWESIASDWKNSRYMPWKEVLDFLADKKGIILDIGCGSGRNFVSGKEYFGIDISKNMLKYAIKDAKKRGITLIAAMANASALPLKNGMFDTVLYIATLHTIKGKPARKKSLLEMKRTMRDGGEAMITVWNRKQPRFDGAREAYVPWKHGGRTYMRYYYLYDKPELRRLLKAAGFEVKRIFDSESKVFNVFPRNIIAIVRKP